MLSTSGPMFATQNAARCRSFQYDFHENIVLSVIFGLAFVVGIVLIFVGYRILRVSLLMQTFALVSTITHVFLLDYTGLSVPVNCVLSALAGFLLGIPSALVVLFGLVFSGAVQGLFFTVTTLFVLSQFTPVQTIWLPIALLIGLCLILTLPVVVWQKPVAIIYLASFGSILLMLSMDFYLNVSQLRKRAYELILLKMSRREPCWYGWTLYSVWPLFMVLGCVVQFLKTAKKCDHRRGTSKFFRLSKKRSKKRLLCDQGDIIAQAWIHASPEVLQKSRVPSRRGDSCDEDRLCLAAGEERDVSSSLV